MSGPRPTRVAVLSHGYAPRIGGIERQRSQVTPLLRHHGVDPFVITRAVPRAPMREVRDGVEVVRTPSVAAALPSRLGRASRVIDSALYTGLGLAVLLLRRPDVIQAHEFLSTSRLGLLAGRLLGVPVIVAAHLSGPEGDVQRSAQSRVRRRLLRRIQRRGALAIAVSRQIDEELAGAGFVRRTTIANGVDVARFHPVGASDRAALRRRLHLTGDPVVVFSGRLEAQKRVDVLLACWGRVRAAVPGAHLVVVGEGHLRAALESSAGAGVTFTGSVDDVAPYLRAADVFVLPSDAEGLSNALLEAQACGLPAVATRVGAAADVVEDGVTGVLVPAGDADALAEALIALLGDPARRQRMGTRARRRMVSRFSLDRTVESYVDAYDLVTGRVP